MLGQKNFYKTHVKNFLITASGQHFLPDFFFTFLSGYLVSRVIYLAQGIEAVNYVKHAGPFPLFDQYQV
jgi:hypothetical protein